MNRSPLTKSLKEERLWRPSQFSQMRKRVLLKKNKREILSLKPKITKLFKKNP